MTGYTRHSSLLVIGYWLLVFGPSFFVSRADSTSPTPLLSTLPLAHDVDASTIYRTQEAQCVTEKPSIEKPFRTDIFNLSASAIIDSCTLPTTKRAIIMSTSVKRARNTCSLHPNIVS